MANPDIGVNLVDALIVVEQDSADVSVQIVESAITVEGGEVIVEVSSPRLEVAVELSGPAGPPGSGVVGSAPIYVGPAAGAPATVTVPTLLVLRETGSPGGDTSLVVREP